MHPTLRNTPVSRILLAGLTMAALTGTAPATPPSSLIPAPQPVDVPTTLGQSIVATPEDLAVGLEKNRATGLNPELLTPTSVTLLSAPDPADASPLPFDPATMMPVSEVRPGQKGYGLTVFNGIRPERFDVEVVGVRHSNMAGMDIILCYLTSPKLKDIGVVAGMSGSPVYINDKLIGAVAYGWPTNKEALAGVTPIADMLRVFNATPGQQPSGEGADATFHAYERYMEMQKTLVRTARGEMPKLPSFEGIWGSATSRMTNLGLTDAPGMQPLAAPVFLSSSHPVTVGLAQQLFPGMMLTPTGAQAAAGGAVGFIAPSLQAANSPGGPVEDLKALAGEVAGGYGLCVPFIEGDLNMAGIGTITYRKGNRLVAFGHPMFEHGITRFPMAPARVNEIVRSIMRPFKVGESLGQVGLITQDRLPAIGGVFGPGADMYPVKATVEDPSYGGKREFTFRIWNDKEMAPMLNMVALQEAAVSAGRGSGNAAVLFEYSIAFDDGTSFSKQQYFADTYGGTTAAYMVGADVGALITNPYKRVRPSAVDFKMRVADRLPEAQLVMTTLDQDVYRPGDTVTVTWDLQPYRKARERRSYSFRLPANLPDGTYGLTVGDSGSRSDLDESRNPGGDRVYNYESLVELVSRNYPRNGVYVTLVDQDTGVAIHGNELPKLPASIIDTFEDTVDPSHLAPVSGNLLVDTQLITPYDVSGSLTETITVRRKM